MEKVDIIIAAVGAVALVATTLGVVFYEDLAGATTVHFDHQMIAVDEQSGTPRSYTFMVPVNATGVDLDIDIDFQGQSGQGGNAAVSITVSGPNARSTTQTGNITVPPNSGSASGAFSAALIWADMPEETTTEDPSSFDMSQSFTEPVTVTVSVTNPADPLAPVPAVDYSWEVTIGGEWHAYSHSFDTGDVESH